MVIVLSHSPWKPIYVSALRECEYHKPSFMLRRVLHGVGSPNNRSLISDLVAALPHFRTRCYTAQENTRRSMLVPFVSNQRPWQRMIRSGCQDSIFATAAFVLLFCNRSGKRIPKNS